MGATLSLNYDGNLVEYLSGSPIWASNTTVSVGGYPKCTPQRTYNGLSSTQVGEHKAPTGGLLGVLYATVLNYSPYVYNTPSDTTSAWVMLQFFDSSFAQVGWIEAPGSYRRTFSESWIEDGSHNPVYAEYPSYSFAIGSAPTYSVQTTGQGEYTYWVNGHYLGQDQMGLQFTSASLASEVHSLPDQMSGGYLSAENQTFTGGEDLVQQRLAELRDWDRV